MKLKIYLACLLLASAAFQNCDDDNDLSKAPAAVEAVFNRLYPNATVKEWEKEGNYIKADFRNGQQDSEAWFLSDGTWVRTETDILPGNLPQAVQEYVTTHYPGYWIDDAELVEMPTGNYYKLDLEKNGARDVVLQLRADGTPVQ